MHIELQSKCKKTAPGTSLYSTDKYHDKHGGISKKWNYQNMFYI